MVKRAAGNGSPFQWAVVIRRNPLEDSHSTGRLQCGGKPRLRLYCATMTQLDLPNGGKLNLRPVTDDDDLFLLSLYGSTRADELNQVVWAEGQKEAFLRWQFDMQKREYDARFPDARHQLIMVDDEPAGRIWVGEDQEQIRLLDISLLPQFQKRGAGTMLLKGLMQEAASAGKFLRHMVFVLNNDAHRFYERLGFVVIEDVGAYKHMEFCGVKSEQ